MPADSIPNVNCLWGEVVAGALAKLGVRHAVIAPGSRSAPLVWGLTRQKEIEAIPVLDERSAGFYALGLAKASGRPVVLVCTSGTAAANFLPAVIEASQSAVPLLVLTADRPPELRDCHAGQAIDQVKIYGHFPRWQHEVALPENRIEMLRYLRQTLIHAWERAQYPWPGPVHLNFPFREPLSPVVDGEPIERRILETLLAKVCETGETTPFAMTANNKAVDTSFNIAKQAQRGLVIAGAMETDRQTPRKLAMLAEGLRKLGWPVLADVLNPLRHCEGIKSVMVPNYDVILRNPVMQRELKPDFIMRLGPLPTSKVLRQWLEKCSAPTIVVQDGPENADPLHQDVLHWRGKSFGVAMALAHSVRATPASRAYARQWMALRGATDLELRRNMRKLDWRFEGKAAWVMSRKLSKGTPVFVASSMPVRDGEYFWEGGGGQVFYFNRGANGIDGTLSSVLGVAHALKKPTVLYTGDLALLHDQNGFLATRELPVGASLTIVLINNNGGGIFEHLPISKFEPPYERFFATPQGVDFSKLAGLHGLEYRCPRTWAAFERALRPLPKQGVRLIELRTDRKRDAAFRAKLFMAISRKIGLK